MKFKSFFVLALIIGAIFLFYKFVLVRTVYYEIGGIKIPSRYNFITGSVRPLANYKGKSNLGTVDSQKTNKIGLSDEEIAIAKLRWAIFEEWVKGKPQYKGWQKSAIIFKQANDAFRREIEASGKIIKVAK